uniref:zinc finger protein CONSTANS-LIKE 1-like n=1 Tax=Erigeron canadensis TaxID=72917 RepID=UPI001CB976B0|nr:zinc finger protein CONSTANS-LIKE 1-like [Erigeron canadensis]
MWSDNSTTNGYGSNRRCSCYSSYCQSVEVPNLCTICHASLYSSNPMNQWYNNNVLPDNQLAPQYPVSSFSNVIHPVSSIFHVENNQQVSEQMAKTEFDSSLLPNPDSREDQNYLPLHQIDDGCLNHTSGSPWAGNQYQGQFNPMQLQGSQVNYEGNYGMFPDQILKFSQEYQYDISRAPFSNNPASLINASLPPKGASNGSFSNIMDFPREWGLNQFSFPPFQLGKLLEETVGSHSNSTSISSEGTQKLYSSKKPFKLSPMSRQDRVLRYFEKKKRRKYGKKIQYSSRKTYAKTRPRVRGRFARSSQTDTNTTV